MKARDSESYGQHGITWVDRLGVWLSQRSIRKWLPKNRKIDVLELGCGYKAAQLVALGDILNKGLGVDFHIAPELKGRADFEFLESSIEDALPRLAGRQFDMIMLISVLEHLHNPAAVLEAAHAMLRPGGIVLINVPSWRGKKFLEFSAFRLGLSPKVEMDDHKMYYNLNDLWPLLVRAGFRPSLIKMFYHKFGLNLFACARKV